MEVVLYSIPPIFATALRFLFASPILIILTKSLGQPLIFPIRKIHWLLVVSLLYFSIPFTLMIYGEQYISSGLASIIFANMPVAIMAISVVLNGLKLRVHQVLGLLFAIVSLCMILNNEMDISGTNYLIGIASLVLAVLMHAVMYVLVQKNCKDVGVLTYNALPCLIASIFLFFVSAYFENVDFSVMALDSLFAVLYLGLVAGVGGIVAYFKLGQMSTPFQASLCFLIFPLIALSISAYMQGDKITHQSEILLIPLFFGMLLTKVTSFPLLSDLRK